MTRLLIRGRPAGAARRRLHRNRKGSAPLCMTYATTPTHQTQHDPRSFEARMLEAAQRGVEGDDSQPRDTHVPEMVVAELVRLVDTMQALSLRHDVFEEELAGRRGMVDARLLRLEDSLKRVADGLQVLILRLDDGK